MLQRAGYVLGCSLDSIEEVADKRMLARLTSIGNSSSHPLQQTVEALGSSFRTRLRDRQRKKERWRRLFLPTANRVFNAVSSPSHNLVHVQYLPSLVGNGLVIHVQHCQFIIYLYILAVLSDLKSILCGIQRSKICQNVFVFSDFKKTTKPHCLMGYQIITATAVRSLPE